MIHALFFSPLNSLLPCRGEGAHGFALAKSKLSLCFVRTDASSGLVEWTCERAGNASLGIQGTNLLDQQKHSLSTPHIGLYRLRRRTVRQPVKSRVAQDVMDSGQRRHISDTTWRLFYAVLAVAHSRSTSWSPHQKTILLLTAWSS